MQLNDNLMITPTVSEQANSKHVIVGLWKYLRWILLIAAIVVRGYIIYHDSPLIGTDQGHQLAATRSLLRGEGITLSTFELEDLSISSPYPLTWWPPLFSILAAPLFALIEDPLFVLVIFSWLAIILIFVGWFIIMETLESELDWRAKTLTWLFWIVLAPPFTYQSTGVTDYLSLGLFLTSIGFSLIAVKRSHIGWAIAASIMMSLSGSLRYAYIPLIVIVPFSFVVCSILRRSWGMVRLAMISSVVSAIIIGFSALSQLALDASNPSAVLQPEQTTEISVLLSKYAPVPAIAFGLGRPWVPGDPNTTVLWMISAGLIILYSLTLIAQINQAYLEFRQKDSSCESVRIFHLVAFFTIGTLFSTFTYLSIKEASNANWYFVQEARYYSPFFGFLVIILANALYHPPIFKWGFRIIIVGLFIVIGVQNTVIEVKSWAQRITFPPYGLYVIEDHPIWQYYSVVKKLADEGRDVIFLSSDSNNYYKGWASLAGASIHHSIHSTNIDKPIATSQPVTLVIFETSQFSEDGSLLLQQLIQEGNLIQMYENDSYKLFIVDLPAGAKTQ